MICAQGALLELERATQPSLGPLEIAEACVNGAQVPECDSDLVVIGAEGLFEDRERAFEQFRRFLVSARGVEDRRERRAIGGDGGVIAPQRSDTDAHRFARGRFTVRRPTGSMSQAADVVKHGRHLGVLGAERCDEDLVGPLVESGRLVKPARVLQQHREVVADSRSHEVCRLKVPLGHSECVPVCRFGGR